jgi:hypothetical protein
MNAASDAQLTQNADANRRANDNAQLQKDQNARAQAQESREATKFAAGIRQTESTLGGWNADADRSGWSVTLNESADAIDRLITDWRRSSGSAKDALAIAGSQQITNFNQAQQHHHTMLGLEMAFEGASEYGDIPDDLIDRYEALMEAFQSGGKGGSGQRKGSTGTAIDDSAKLLRDLNKHAESTRRNASDKQARIDIRNELIPMMDELQLQGKRYKDGNEEDWTDSGKDEFEEINNLGMKVLDSLNPSKDNSIEKSLQIFRNFQTALQIYGDPTVKEFVQSAKDSAQGDRKAQERASAWGSVITGFQPMPNGEAGDSIFTRWLSRYHSSSVNGNGDEFNPGWNNAELVAQTESIEQIIKSMEGVHGENTYTRPQLMEMAHRQIVISERGMALALTPKGATPNRPGRVSQEDHFRAWEFYNKSFGKEQHRKFPGAIELDIFSTSKNPLIADIRKETVRKGAGKGIETERSDGLYPVLGEDYKGLFKAHNDMLPVKVGGWVQGDQKGDKKVDIERGRFGIHKIFKDQGKDIRDFAGLSFSEIHEKDRDIAAAIYKWQSHPGVQSGAIPPETYFNNYFGESLVGMKLAETFTRHKAQHESDETDQNFLPDSLGKGWATESHLTKGDPSRSGTGRQPDGPGGGAYRPGQAHGPMNPMGDPTMRKGPVGPLSPSLGPLESGPVYDPRDPNFREGRPAHHEDPRFQLTDTPDNSVDIMEQADADQERVGKFESHKKREDARRAANAGLRAPFGLSPLDPVKKPDVIKAIEKKLKGNPRWTGVKAADAEEMGKRLTDANYEVGGVTMALRMQMGNYQDDMPDGLMEPLIKSLKAMDTLENSIHKSKASGKSRTVLLKRLFASEARVIEAMEDIESYGRAQGQAQAPPVQQSNF